MESLKFKYFDMYSEKANITKSSSYFWLALHRTKVRWRFRKILWPSQNIWTLSKHVIISQFSFHQMFCYENSFRVSPTFQVAVYYSFMAHKVTTALKVSLLALPKWFLPINYVDFHRVKVDFCICLLCCLWYVIFNTLMHSFTFDAKK